VEAHDVSDASLYAVDGGVSDAVEVEVGSRQDIGCSGRLKQGSGAQSNTAEDRLLVAGGQTS